MGGRLRMRVLRYRNPLRISGTPIPAATQNIAYGPFDVVARGGTPPYSFTLPEGQLPAGVTMTGTGSARSVSGTPTGFGLSENIVIRVTDSADPPATADLGPFDIDVAEAPGGDALPATQTVDFGAKTRVGHGGYPLGYTGSGTLEISAGNGSGHFKIDGRNHLTPKNGSAAYGAVGPTFAGPYSLTVVERVDGELTGASSAVTVNIVPDAAHIREMTTAGADATSDTTSSFQLRTLLGLKTTAAGAMLRGDTIWCRSGYMNPTSASWGVRPPAGGYGGDSGYIVIRSEEADDHANLDGYGNPRLEHGCKIGRLSLDSAVSGDIEFPFHFTDVWFYLSGEGNIPGVLLTHNDAGHGVKVDFSLFSRDGSLTTPAATDGYAANQGALVHDCRFFNLSKAITGGFAESKRNVGHELWDDGHTKGMAADGSVNADIEDNFFFNWRKSSGSHPDVAQHAGLWEDPSIGVGDGSTTTFTGTLPGAPLRELGSIYYGNLRKGGVTRSVTTGALSGAGLTTGSTLDTDTGDYTLVFSAAPPSGADIRFVYKADNTETEKPFGSWKRNITVRGDTPDGSPDVQAYYIDDTRGTSRLTEAEIELNIAIHSYTWGVDAVRLRDPSIRGNLTLNVVDADYGGANSSTIQADSGDGGTITHNAANAINTASQTGTVTITPNATLSRSLTAYRTAIPGYAYAGLTNRAAVIAAFTPADLGVASGGLKNPDGTFNGPLFPDGSWNDFQPYEEGRLPPAT